MVFVILAEIQEGSLGCSVGDCGRSGSRSCGLPDLDRRQADLDYRQAQARLAQIKESNQDLQKDAQDAFAKGVDGADNVVAAQDRVVQANQGVQDAEQNLADTRAQAARDVSDAEIRGQATVGGNLCAPPSPENPRGDHQAALLAVGGEAGLTVGAPTVPGATVTATVLEQKRGEKIIIFKKRRRQNSRRKNGHRQNLTVLRIGDIAA